jgi:hypothetical protein
MARRVTDPGAERYVDDGFGMRNAVITVSAPARSCESRQLGLLNSLRPAVAAGALLLMAAPIAAQRPVVWIDALASSARPPADVVDQTTGVYGLLGGRATWAGDNRSFDVGGYIGVATRAEDGRWGTLIASGKKAWRRGNTSAAAQVEFLGLHYTDPFRYTAGAATLTPTLTRAVGRASFSAFGNLTVGGWSSSVAVDSIVRADSSGPLRVAGGGGALTLPLGHATATLTARVADAVNGRIDGTYGIGTAALSRSFGALDLGADITGLSGPEASELGGTIRMGRSFGAALYASAEFARVVSDPVFGARGYTGATVSISWRPGGAPRALPEQGVAVIGARQANGTSVEFRLRGVSAERADLVGSFTNWEPRAMEKRQGEWRLRVTLPRGTHQFGFLLNGETWYLPKDAPGVVDDGFGRRNATITVGDL